MEEKRAKYPEGPVIFRSGRCPYLEKYVAAIMESAEKKYGMKPRLVEMEDAEMVQDSPCPFGTFCIMYNGEVISSHPISNGRFENIMGQIMK